MITLKKSIATGMLALAIVGAGISFQPTQSYAAGRLLGAAIVGAVVGGVIANRRNVYSGNHSNYTPPAYYQPACHWQNHTRYDAYGNPYVQRVKVCQ